MGNSAEPRPSNRESLRDEALCRSVFYGALSLGLHLPSPESLESLCSEDARLALLDAASLLMASAPPTNGFGSATPSEEAAEDLVARMNDWVQTFDSLTLDAWLSAHPRLFVHTPRGLVSPYETE